MAALTVVTIGVLVALALQGGTSSRRHVSRQAGRGPSGTGAVSPASVLQPGSDPSVLPGPILIADNANNRLLEIDPNGNTLWEFPAPGDLAPGETFRIPDDAFFTPDGKGVIATQEDDFALSLIDVATHRIVWRYGVPGVPGSGPNRVWNPDDAIVLPDGYVLTADIKNCRLLLIPPGGHAPAKIYGTTGSCVHRPPRRYGSPNGAFPMTNGHYLVTEINGDWVDEMALDGRVMFSTHPPHVRYPSDSNEVSPGVYLTVDYSKPGAIVTFGPTGHQLWRFAPAGANALNHPSLAVPLPNGDILCTDDFNDRVIVVDPRTNRIVWQYGRTGVPGRSAGLLHTPDGLDLAPPLSLAVRHAPTMGTPTPNPAS